MLINKKHIGLNEKKMKIHYFAWSIFIITSLHIFSANADADVAEKYFHLGNENRKQGYYIQAISDYTKAIKINPKFIDAYNNRGTVNLYILNYAQAISDFNKVIEINTKLATPYYNLGVVYQKE